MNFSNIINAELIHKYKKDKVKEYLLKSDKKTKSKSPEDLDNLAEDFLKKNTDNLELMKKVTDFVIVQYSDAYEMKVFYESMNKAKRFGRKSFHVSNIERIYSSKIISYSFGLETKRQKKDEVLCKDMTGLFKISFSDGTFLYYAKWYSGGGKARAVEGMFATEGKVWYRLIKHLQEAKKKAGRPKNGIYRIYSINGALIYEKMDKLQETPIVHPSIQELEKDMNFYFEHVDLFTRFGMPGVRKILFVGPPGTGKSSACVKLAKHSASEKCIVFSTSISDIAKHLFKCAKFKVSTIAILEDAESTLQNANSELLNFLDGVDQPKNDSGSYVIMTTNHPDRIEARIRNRPGRIDKIFQFGELKDEFALRCAQIYFDGIYFNDKNIKDKAANEKILRIVNGMSGASIKELSQATASFVAGLGENSVVTADIIREVKNKMFEDIKNVDKFAKSEADMLKKVGFGMTQTDSGNPFDMEEIMKFSKVEDY